MYVLVAQFNNQGGPYGNRNYKLVLDVDETQKEGVLNLAHECDKGTELLLFMFKADQKDTVLNETQEETRTRFVKRMHVMIKNIAKEENKTPEEIKESLKKYLINKKYMVKSSKELTLNGLAAAIYYLQTEFKLKNEDYE